MDAADIERFRVAVERLADVADRMEVRGTVATNTVTIGDRGVFAALMAAALMFGMNLALLVMLNSHDRKIDDLTHYLNAIYMIAPSLKPAEK